MKGIDISTYHIYYYGKSNISSINRMYIPYHTFESRSELVSWFIINGSGEMEVKVCCSVLTVIFDGVHEKY